MAFNHHSLPLSPVHPLALSSIRQTVTLETTFSPPGLTVHDLLRLEAVRRIYMVSFFLFLSMIICLTILAIPIPTIIISKENLL